MSVLILGDPQGWYVRELLASAAGLSIEARAMPFEKLSGCVDGRTLTLNGAEGESLENIRTVVVRSMPPGSLEQVVFRMDLLWSWEQAGIEVINSPKALECAIDKYLTLVRLQRAGVSVPRTIVSETTDAAMNGFQSLGGDVVVKPIFGAEGRGITRLNDPDLAWRVFKTLEQTRQVIYQQEFLDHGGSDIRILLLNGVVLGAMKRVNPLDFRTNLARSAHPLVYVPSDEEVDLARRAAQAVGARFAGIDLIRTRSNDLFAIEVNGVPGWKGLQQTTTIRIADAFWRTILPQSH
ncbi:ATP-grasp domain-containing protein [Lacunimicrobium album]